MAVPNTDAITDFLANARPGHARVDRLIEAVTGESNVAKGVVVTVALTTRSDQDFRGGGEIFHDRAPS